MQPFVPLQVDAVLNVASDPISIVLALIGGLLVGGPSLLFGYLALRGIVAAIVTEPGRGPPGQGQ